MAIETRRGRIKRVVFEREGFVIAKLEGGLGVKGNLPDPRVGLEYEFEGIVERHPRFGETLAFSSYKTILPTDHAGLRAYLEETCRWIGPVTSKALVDTYGEKVLDMCRKEYTRVSMEIPGITLERAKEISDELTRLQDQEKVQVELREIFANVRIWRGIISRIAISWGVEAPARIKENPYALIESFKGIGFTTADSIARALKFPLDGEFRIRAGIFHVLEEFASGKGHTAPEESAIRGAAAELLQVEAEKVGKVMKSMIEAEDAIRDGSRFCRPSLYKAETHIATKLKELIAASPIVGAKEPNLEGLAEDQRAAVSGIARTNVAVLTGPPGTGKTFTIKRILETFPEARRALAAPTGKAAKRMFEQSGHKASTIHRLLGPMPLHDGTFGFHYGEGAPIPYDVVVLDEVSMVDVSLMSSFLAALRPGTRLLLVGDPDQLPSVGPGEVLGDLIASGTIPVFRLEEIKRQDAGLIVQNCHRIRKGMDITHAKDAKTKSDFYFVPAKDAADSVNVIIELVCRRIPIKFGVDPIRDVQVISPTRELTPASCKALNEKLQTALNEANKRKLKFWVGDKVIQLKNDYRLQITNGDIGYVREIDESQKLITVVFENPERVVELPLRGNDLELAYAVTCHKYQGSEAPFILFPVLPSFPPMLVQRNWLYTALSRAQKVCLIVGDRAEIPKIIKRVGQNRRSTLLSKKLSTSRV